MSRTSFVATVAAPLTALALVTLPVLAQQASDTARLRPVVVTGTLIPVRSDASPEAVTVVSGAELRAAGIVRVADALRLVPGVALVQSGSVGAATSLFMRGGNSNYVKVLVDGVPLNAPGGAIDLAHLTTDDISRIEIVRGPASVLYGSDAVSGVVQIFTRDGSARPSATIAARGGTFGTREASGELAGTTGTTGWSLSGASRRTDGMLAFNNDYRNDAGAGALRANLAGTDLHLAARTVNATFHFPTNGSGVPDDSNAFRDERRWVVGLDASRAIGSYLRARVAATTSDTWAHDDNSPDSPGDTVGFYSTDRARTYRRGADARVDARLPGDNTLTIGGAFERQQVRSDGTSRFAAFEPSSTDFSAHRTNKAGYAQLLGAGERAFTYSVGARIDDNSAFGTFATGRASAALRVAPRSRLRAAVGSAFKEPAFEETFTSTYTIGNPNLRPERTRSWEIGAEQLAFDDRLQLTATWFDQRFRNLIQYVSGTAESGYRGTNSNLAAATARGLEVEARLFRLGWLDAGANYTRLTTRVTDAGNGAFGVFEQGAQLLRRPANQGSIDLGVRTPRALDLRLAVQLVGRRDDRDFNLDERVELPGYARVDLGGEYRVPGAHAVAITARVDNLLDKRYEPVLHFTAPGRTLLLGARVGR